MNPVIVIPTYWTRSNQGNAQGIYQHATALNDPHPPLDRALLSLTTARGILRTVIMVSADSGLEVQARARVAEICTPYKKLNPLIVGAEEESLIHAAISQVSPRFNTSWASLNTQGRGAGVSRIKRDGTQKNNSSSLDRGTFSAGSGFAHRNAFTGPGVIKNLAFLIAAVENHDLVVFFGDDEEVLNDQFLIDAVYGMGSLTRQSLPILAKSGYFIDSSQSPYAPDKHVSWQERYWSNSHEFNEWMHTVLHATRISRANSISRGCFAVLAPAFTRVPYDPFIPCGEDLDYLLNLRMSGIETWIDNQWKVYFDSTHPAETPERFSTNIYRWSYEVEKLTYANMQESTRRIRPESLMPYPGHWITPQVHKRISHTARRRAVTGPKRLEYLKILTHTHPQARAWARETSTSYFSFLTFWERLITLLWDNKELAARLELLGGMSR